MKKMYNVPLSFVGLIFIILKLTGIIDWSWIWVTMPFWGSFVFFVFFSIIITIITIIFNKNNDKL